ncbi:4-hydroxybenzoate polyprenyl transferase [Diplodia corticola]|uniref:4-hydroxybenzoate polyprenyl transferase n=1 Tax=Diplodia corticola TaxID=236234 RepID=A0A1J9SD46_9PEZI|nr:4-hydroxybenzoate polyprenyl transferase [Diplodia corticola]OJD37493.1 4-hydroxybenzoate polyprenyl transferase [Diplodia corticola]
MAKQRVQNRSLESAPESRAEGHVMPDYAPSHRATSPSEPLGKQTAAAFFSAPLSPENGAFSPAPYIIHHLLSDTSIPLLGQPQPFLPALGLSPSPGHHPLNMADADVFRHPSARGSPRKRSSQPGSRSHPDSAVSAHSTPPASPESTAEYWDRCVEKMEENLERRRMRRAAAMNSPDGMPPSPRQTNRMVLDIISSYSDDSTPTASPRAPPAFDFGFPHERERADSAHDIESIAEALQLFPKPLASAKSRHHATSLSTSSIKAQGLRKEGQTLASPVVPMTPPTPPATESSKRHRKCPTRPPRPDEPFIGLPITPSPHPYRLVRRPAAPQERRSAAPPNIRIAPLEPTSPSKSTSTLPNLEPMPPLQCLELTPPTTPVRTSSFALQQQLISVWEDDDDDEDKIGLMEYVRRTLQASKTSFSGERDRESREREREREKGKRKESMDSAHSAEKRPMDRRRRSTVRQAVIRVFRCGDSKEEHP